MLRFVSLAAAVALAAPAVAADQPTPRIVVTGVGRTQTPPDTATIGWSVHGEGPTAEAALAAMVAKRKAIDAGLATMPGAPLAVGGDVSVREVRARECDANSYGPPRLTVGACAVIGYVADLSQTVRTGAIKNAATLAGYVGQLGGRDPRVQSYSLRDEAPARRRAIAAALADARQKAEAIAAGSDVRLGILLSASDGSGERPERDVFVPLPVASPPPPPPPPPPPSVSIDVTPDPIETQANVTVSYAIAGG